MAGPVRQPIDIASLEKFLEKNEPSIVPPLDLKQFGFGQSNPTYQITDATSKKYVMRKKPPGELMSKTAHQVEREYHILRSLAGTGVPVPKVYLLCEDPAVIGTAFYIMEFLDGRFITDPQMPGVTADHRKEMWRDVVRTLVKLHTLDYKKIGLANWGKNSGFYNRQIKTFTTLAKRQAKVVDVETKVPVGDIPHLDELTDFFQAHQPRDRSAIVHGDYKIDNIVFHKTEPRVIGLLDWEMSTIGHPLSDFVSLVSPMLSWGPPRETVPGMPTLAECIAWYQESGYNVESDLTWGQAFQGFRGSVIMQGIDARFALRQASGAHAASTEYLRAIRPDTEKVWQLVQKLRESYGGKGKL